MSFESRAAAVRFDAVSKHYGAVVAVKEISFEVNAGDLVTLLGPSGCGKTTTLRLIAGLEMPTSGSIFIGDENVSRLPASARDVSMVFQSYALFPHMTVFENVAYGLSVSGVSKSETRNRAEDGLIPLFFKILIEVPGARGWFIKSVTLFAHDVSPF